MKLKFRLFSLLIVVSALSSCNFRTISKKINFLTNKYQLSAVCIYSDEHFKQNSLLSYTSIDNFKNYFDLDKSMLFFNFNKESGISTFDFSLKNKKQDLIEVKNVIYELNMDGSARGTIKFSSECWFFDNCENLTYPNYWFRIHKIYELDEEENDLIFEYKSLGQNVNL